MVKHSKERKRKKRETALFFFYFFLQKKKTFPVNFQPDKNKNVFSGIRCASIDGDCDRLVYFWGKGGKI